MYKSNIVKTLDLSTFSFLLWNSDQSFLFSRRFHRLSRFLIWGKVHYNNMNNDYIYMMDDCCTVSLYGVHVLYVWRIFGEHTIAKNLICTSTQQTKIDIAKNETYVSKMLTSFCRVHILLFPCLRSWLDWPVSHEGECRFEGPRLRPIGNTASWPSRRATSCHEVWLWSLSSR